MDLSEAPPNAYSAPCKDCGTLYSYSVHSSRKDEEMGRDPPERCSECRRLHAQEIARIGVSHFVARGRDGGPVPAAISIGRLGKIYHPSRTHRLVPANSQLESLRPKFGIKNEEIDHLFRALRECQVVIVEGATGSGKSTFLPYCLVEPNPVNEQLWRPRGPVVVTQPRIHATAKIPEFVAKLLGSGVGPGLDIGFRYHGNDQSDISRNRLIFVTDGLLLNWLTDGSLIHRLGAIMIDEAHERSVNIDIILALLKRILPRYPFLKLIIASATIDTGFFRSFFGGVTTSEGRPGSSGDPEPDDLAHEVLPTVPLVKCSAGITSAPDGKGYDLKFRTDEPRRRLDYEGAKDRTRPAFIKDVMDALTERILQILRDPGLPDGDIVGFVHTTDAVKDIVKTIRDHLTGDPAYDHVDVLPLYSNLSAAERERATQEKEDPSRRRVVIATNIAETSLTIEDLLYVVDSGLIVQPRWDDDTGQMNFPTRLHSQAGCQQRWGRVGRTQPGYVFCLYTEGQFQQFKQHTDPEIVRSPLDQAILKVKSAGVEPRHLDWLQRPSAESFDGAEKRLKRVGALDEEGKITPRGLELRNTSLDPDLAALVIASDQFCCAIEMATLAALLSARGGDGLLLTDPNWDAFTRRAARRAHRALRRGVRDDVELLLKVFAAWNGECAVYAAAHEPSEWSSEWFVNHDQLTDLKKQRDELLLPFAGHGKESKSRPIDFSLLDRVRGVIAMAEPRAIFRRDSHDRQWLRYLGGEPAVVGECSVLGENHTVERITALKTRRIWKDRKRQLQITKAAALGEEWAPPFPATLIERGLLVARHSRDDHGALVARREIQRLLLDQWAPPGTRFLARRPEPGDDVIELTARVEGPHLTPTRARMLAPRPDLTTGTAADDDVPFQPEEASYWSDQADNDLNDDGSLPELEADGGEEDRGAAGSGGTADEENDEASAVEANASGQRPVGPRGTTLLASLEDSVTPNDAEFPVEVTGHDLAHEPPLVVVRPLSDPPPEELFRRRFAVGDNLTLVVQEVDPDPEDDRFNVLITTEPETGLQVLLEPEDVTFDRCGWAMQALDPGTHLQARLEGIEDGGRRVSASLLPFVLDDRNSHMQDWPELVQATVGCVNPVDRRIELLLEVSRPEQSILHTVSISERELKPRVLEEFSQGQQLHVRLRKGYGRAELRAIPDGFEPGQLDERLHWDPERYLLTFNGQMLEEERGLMAGQVELIALKRAIAELYHDSNRLRGEILDPVLSDEFERRHPVDSQLSVKIVDVRPDYLVVCGPSLPRYRIPRSELSWESNPTPSAVGSPGKDITVAVYREGPALGLSLRRLTPDPIERYVTAAGKDLWLDDGVIAWHDYGRGLGIEFPGTVEGFLSYREIDNGNYDANQRFPIGDKLRVRVLAADVNKRELALSSKALDVSPDHRTAPKPRTKEPVRRQPPPPAPPKPKATRDATVDEIVRRHMPDVEVVASVRISAKRDGETRSGAKVALRDFRNYRKEEAQAVRGELRRSHGVEYLQFLKWSDDAEQLIRDVLASRGPSGMTDIVTQIQWGRAKATVTVRHGFIGRAVGWRGLNVRLMASFLGLEQLTIKEPA